MSATRVLYGFHAVLSRLRQGATGVQEIYVDSARNDARAQELAKVAAERAVRVIAVDAQRLEGHRPRGTGVAARNLRPQSRGHLGPLEACPFCFDARADGGGSHMGACCALPTRSRARRDCPQGRGSASRRGIESGERGGEACRSLGTISRTLREPMNEHLVSSPRESGDGAFDAKLNVRLPGFRRGSEACGCSRVSTAMSWSHPVGHGRKP